MADLEPVEGNPFASPAPPSDGSPVAVEGNPFAASGPAPLGAAPLIPVQGDPFVQDKPEAGLTPVAGDPFSPTESVPPPPSSEALPEHNSIVRGAVSGFLKSNPELGGYALEALSHDAPEFLKGSLISGSRTLKDLSLLSPKEYDTKAGSFFSSLQGGLNPTLDFLGEGLGSGLASMAPSIAGGLVGAGVGGAGGAIVVGPPGAAIGATGGAIFGAGGVSYALNLGEVYKALLDEKIDPLQASRIAKAAAVPMAALDVASVGPIISRLGGLSEVKKEVARAIARRVAAEAGKGAVREGGTEAAQEVVKVATVSMAADKPFWSIDNVDAIVGSGVVGGITGFSVAGASGIKRDNLAPRPPTPQEVQQVAEGLPKVGGESAPATVPNSPITEVLRSGTAQDPSWYYSEVRKVAEEKLPNVARPEQILATLENSPGVKKEEIAALGIPEFLAEAKGPVSKADLITHIEDRAVQVETVDDQERPQPNLTLRAIGNLKDIAAVWAAEEAPGWKIVRVRMDASRAGQVNPYRFNLINPQGDVIGVPHTTLEAAEGRLNRELQGPGNTEYGRWTLPGGENYRETKLTLPQVGKPKTVEQLQADKQFLKEFDNLDHAVNVTGRAGVSELVRFRDMQAQLSGKEVSMAGQYQSPHFDEPNVVAHFRAKDRVDAEGKRGLGIEEIQSDWHQEGRKVGYGKQVITDADVLQEAQRFSSSIGEDWNRVPENLKIGYLKGAREQLEQTAKVRPPDAPFKTSWPELALKRILRMAADEGHQRVYIMPGIEQARRYGQEGKEKAGQIEFYDNILPRLMDKWAKKLGGKTGVTSIILPEENDAIRGHSPARSIAVRYIELSPEMQTRISRGLPLFSGIEGEIVKPGITVFEESGLPQATTSSPQYKAMVSAAKQAALAVGQIAKKMGIDIPIRLQLLANTAFLGQLHVNRDQNGNLTSFQIDLNVPVHHNVQEMYATIAHEFGHALHRFYFGKASNLTKMRIHLAFTKYQDTIRGETSLLKILKQRDNFITDSFNTRQLSGKGRSILDMAPEMRNYWLSFDEWMAEQVAKWMTTSEKPLSIVDKFYFGLAKKIRELYSFFKTRFGDIGEPTKQVADWLNSLLTETDVMGYETVRALENRTTQINQSAMKTDGAPYFPAEPSTGSTILMHELFSSMPASPGLASGIAAVDRYNKFYGMMLSMVQLAARNPHIAALQRYRELWQVKQLERTQIMDGALTTLKGWRKLNSSQQDAVAGLIDDYMNMEFLTPQEKVAGVARRPTPAELNTLATNNKVSSQGLNVFAQVVKDFDDMLTRYGEILIAKANEISDPVAQAVRLQAIGDQIAQLRKQPYFPAMRFGDLTVTIKNAVGSVIHFETFESEKKRKAGVRELTSRLKPGETMQLGVLTKDSAPLIGMPPGLLDLMEQKLALSPSQKGALEQLRFELAPAQSFKHRFQRKNRTPGYSSDFMQAYANYFFHGSNYFTNIKYIDALREQIKEVKDSARLMFDGTKRGMIHNFLSDHLAYMMDPKPDFAALRSFAFLWFLGYSPAAAAINLSQMLIGTGPFLSSKFGDGKAMAAMMKSGANLSTFYKKATLAGNTTDREVRAINEGVKEGVITEAMAPELAAISEGRNLQKGFGGNLAQKSWQRFMEHSAWMFEMTEQTNRRITFRAAFKLATDNPAAPYVAESVAKHKLQFDKLKAAGWTDQDAAAFVVAKDAVEVTQYIYQPYAQPRFMRGHLRTVFVFKTFLQNTLFFLWNYPSAAIRSILIMGFLGGLMGVPGADDLKGILKAIAWQIFGKSFDLEQEARKFIMDMADGSIPPDLILHGMSRRGFGLPMVADHMGVPLPTVDMSKSIGMGQISPVDVGALFGPGSTRDPSRALADTTQRASGAVFGTGFNIYKALTDGALDWNDFKRWERMEPRFAASVSKSYRAMSEGRERDRRGNTVIRYDVTDPKQMMEALALGAGFQPLRATAEWDRRTAQTDAIQYWDLRRQGLLNQLWAARDGKGEDYNQVLGAIRKFNTDLPMEAAGKAISADSIKRSFETRVRSQNSVESGQPRVRGDIPLAREIQRLYPEAEIDVRKVK